MEFIFKLTGTKLSTDNPFVVEQMKKSDAYEAVKEQKAEPKKAKKAE